jgi:hypothetical protein
MGTALAAEGLPLNGEIAENHAGHHANKKSLQLSVVLVFALLSVSASHSQGMPCPKDGRPDCPRAVVFFHRVRDALAKNDRNKIAVMMDYPFLTWINHRKVQISTPARFLNHFSEIFDRGVRCEILGATDKDVWGNSDGFTVGGGAIWFDDLLPPGEKLDPDSPDYWTKGSFKIITVNNESYYPCAQSAKAEK